MDIASTVSLLNQERDNNRLYVSLVQSRATFYADDKTLPNLPSSVVNVMQTERNASRSLVGTPGQHPSAAVDSVRSSGERQLLAADQSQIRLKKVTFMRFLRVLAPVLCVLLPLSAVETQVWEHSESADFEKGTLHKLSLSSEGRLTPAPVVREIYDPSVSFLWAVARDSKGNVYAGGGGVGSSKSKLIVVNAAGQSKTLAELDGMAIQAIAIDKQDRVYAATSPDGKVYRVDAAGNCRSILRSACEIHLGAGVFEQRRFVRRHRRSRRDPSRDRRTAPAPCFIAPKKRTCARSPSTRTTT